MQARRVSRRTKARKMVEDIMLNKARKWFTNHGIGVGAVRSYNGAIDGLDWIGYKAYGADGEVAGIVSLDELRVEARSVKPLLVVSYEFQLSGNQAALISERLHCALKDTGWITLVIDAQTEGKVQAFGIDLPMLDTLSTDSIIELLEALKRVREATTHGGIGVANT